MEKKGYNSALIKYRLATMLIWLGVLTWLPFILLRIAGEKPPLYWFLPFHLAGVVGGSRLRTAARRDLKIPVAKKNILQMLGHGLIFTGILVWVPYFYLKTVVHSAVDVMNFLPYHLTGVLSGIALLGIRYLISRRHAKG
jgi:hypothetical protein